jgi:hypothetical protein
MFRVFMASPPKIHCFQSLNLLAIQLETPVALGRLAILQGVGMNTRKGKTLAGKEVIRDSKVCLREGWQFRRTSEIWVCSPPQFMEEPLLGFRENGLPLEPRDSRNGHEFSQRRYRRS